MKKTKIVYLYKTPRKKIYKKWEKGEYPDTILYGANQLEKLGYQVDFFDISFSNLNPMRWLFYPIQLISAKTTGIGFKLDQAITLLPILNNYDVIVSTIDTAGLPILLLKKLHLFNKPVIYISIDFAYRLESNKNKWPFTLYQDLLKYANTVICYSKAEKQILSSFNKNTNFIPVGIDTAYFSNTKFDYKKNKIPTILAFGRDSERDYATFINALKNTKYKGIIICSKNNIKGLKIPQNIDIYYDLIPKSLKQKIINADIIVIPVKITQRAAGQLSLLDALVSKKPVIVPNIKSIITTYNLEDRLDCLFYKPEESKDLKLKIKYILENPQFANKLAIKGQKKVIKYSTTYFAKRLAHIIQKFSN